MSDARQTAAQAADIITAQGWCRHGGYAHTPYLPPEQCPVDLASALALAAGIGIHDFDAQETPSGVYGDAVMLVARHVLGEDCPQDVVGALAQLTDWQDEDGRTAEDVVAALRGAAESNEEAEDVFSAVRELAAAIRAAIDPPSAATHEGDLERDRLVARRALYVSASLEALGWHGDLKISAAMIRRKTAQLPVSYPVAQNREDGR